SFDSLRDPASSRKYPSTLSTWGIAALLIQIAVIYPLSAIQKWPGRVWRDGTAVYYALNIDAYVSSIGHALLLFPSFLKAMTHAVLWFELLGTLLLFSPVCSGPLRLL